MTSLALFVSQSGNNVSLADVDEILRGGADIDAFGDECTALGWAARRGYESLAVHLLKRGASVDRGHINGQSPLALAAAYGHASLARALLAAGADVERADCDGLTPLMLCGRPDISQVLLRASDALNTLDVSCVRLLLAHGANVNATDSSGWTPLLYATDFCDDAIVRWMLAAGARVDVGDKSEWTPLIYIADLDGRMSVAQVLIDAGVNVHAATSAGGTALSIAREQRSDEMANMLVAAARHTPQEQADAHARLLASLDSYKRALARDRLDLIRFRAAEISIGLEPLELPALVSLTIIEEAC